MLKTNSSGYNRKRKSINYHCKTCQECVSQITISRKQEFQWGISSRIVVLDIYHSREDKKCQKVCRRMLMFSGFNRHWHCDIWLLSLSVPAFFLANKGKHATPLTPVLLIMKAGLTRVMIGTTLFCCPPPTTVEHRRYPWTSPKHIICVPYYPFSHFCIVLFDIFSAP